jgi:hypothetical protein
MYSFLVNTRLLKKRFKIAGRAGFGTRLVKNLKFLTKMGQNFLKFYKNIRFLIFYFFKLLSFTSLLSLVKKNIINCNKIIL